MQSGNYFSEGFESGTFDGWQPSGNIEVTTYNPHSGAYAVEATTSYPGQQACITDSVSSSSIVEASAWVYFYSLDIPQGSITRLELLSLSGNSWQYSVAASINNPSGTPLWTLEIYNGGNIERINGPDSPQTNTWYHVDVIRDLSDGQATLYVTQPKTEQGVYGNYRILEASQSCSMNYNTNSIGVGIDYQSDDGYNQVTVDDISVQWGLNTYSFAGTVSQDQIWNFDLQNPNSTQDSQIYDQTCSSGSNEHFVFLWVCNNANIEGSAPGYGMAYAWSNGAIQNDGYNDGYQYPDGTGYAFISFDGPSPWLYQGMEGTGMGYNTYKDFLVFFYYFALNSYATINEALDMASYQTGFYDFSAASFAYQNAGCWAYNPWNTSMAPAGFYQGFMRVYGDGNVILPQSEVWEC